MKRTPSKMPPKFNSGFTLVELLLAITLMSILLASDLFRSARGIAVFTTW